MENNGIKILGFTDSVNECECCGKKGLKGAFAFRNNGGEIFYWGSSCIKKAYQMNQKEFTSKIKEDEKERKNQARAEFFATPEGAFYKEYIGSKEHDADIKSAGFDLVFEKIRPAELKMQEIRVKYAFKFLAF